MTSETLPIATYLYTDWDVCEVPEWALNYLINGDPSGLSDADLDAANAWACEMRRRGYSLQYLDFCYRNSEGYPCVDDEAEPHFSAKPEFGLATSCYTCFFGKYAD